MTRVAITGVNGFVGKHLAREFVNCGIKVIGVGRESDVDAYIADICTTYYSADLATQWPDIEAVDAVIHLAGLAAVGPSFDSPQSYINLNSAMLTHMAEFYLVQDKKPRIVVVSSGAIYNPDQEMPLDETSVTGFTSPYAVSKALVENQCTYYKNRGLDCVVVRPFNHIGPGQLRGFLVPDVITQLKEGDSVTVGNITTKRDYTDVRDIVRAYRLLATTPQLNHSVYNACSGHSVAGSEIVESIKTIMNKPYATVEIDQTKVRPTDPGDIYGDCSRLISDTGWKPEYSLRQTLADIINECR